MITRRSKNPIKDLFKITGRANKSPTIRRIRASKAPGNRRRIGSGVGKVRYAVAGLGHIAQVAVLPAFKNASKNSELVALFSGDADKRRELGRRYHVPILSSYDQYDPLLRSGNIDAIYIAEPNSLH